MRAGQRHHQLQCIAVCFELFLLIPVPRCGTDVSRWLVEIRISFSITPPHFANFKILAFIPVYCFIWNYYTTWYAIVPYCLWLGLIGGSINTNQTMYTSTLSTFVLNCQHPFNSELLATWRQHPDCHVTSCYQWDWRSSGTWAVMCTCSWI